jgi:dienelactone hydrolase
LDRWDERRVQQGNEVKNPTQFVLDAALAFPGGGRGSSIAEFCLLAEQAVRDQSYFDEPDETVPTISREKGWISFQSSIQSGTPENDVVWASMTTSGSLDKALVVFHHWNAAKLQRQIADFFSKRGVAVIEMSLPYHFQRRRPGSVYADHMLSPNVGRTLSSVRQAVLDGRKLIRWLKDEGYSEITVLGMSLGSWIAGLIAAHDNNVSKASLFLTADSLADMVWTGRATQAIRQSLEGQIELTDLRRAWGPIDQANYTRKLTRSGLDVQLVLAKRDKVVVPELSARFLHALKEAGGNPDVLALNCGHYSLALPPHIIFAGLRLNRLLKRP